MSLKKPSEKRFRVPSSEDEEVMHVGDEAGDAMMLKSILEKLEKLDLLEQIHERLKKIESDYKELKDTVAQIENGLNSITKDVEEVKIATEQKADKSRVEALEKEVEDLRNRSRRNNLVFYNIPEKAEGEDCISFIQKFISTHMGLETLCGELEIGVWTKPGPGPMGYPMGYLMGYPMGYLMGYPMGYPVGHPQNYFFR